MMPGESARAFLCACVAASLALAGGNFTLGGILMCRRVPPIDTCAPGLDCCDSPNTSQLLQGMYGSLKARDDIDDVLRGRLARFEPVGAALGTRSVASPPFSVEAALRWAGTPSPPSTLSMRLHVTRIFEVDQTDAAYKMRYTLQLRWRDCRLVHSCKPLSVTDHDPDYASFWKPPILVPELQEEVLQVASHTIHGNGTDDYLVSRVSHFYCPFDFSDIPWDVQRCTLNFAFPAGLQDHFMNLQWSDPAVTSGPLKSQGWDFQQGPEWTRVPLPAAESRLAVQFTMTRKSAALEKNFIYPAMFFYLASWAGLWIDRQAVPARTMMSLIPVLITVNKYTQLSSLLPMPAYSTRLDQFLFSQIIILVLHVLEFALVHYVERSLQHAEGPKETDDAGGPENPTARMGGPSGARRRRLRVFAVVQRHFETHARWVSPAAYAVMVLWLYHP